MSYVDMHIHSTYSDGTMTPEEIVRAAKQNGVGVLAVADHEMVGGSLAIKSLCAAAGIGYVVAAENMAQWGDTFHHVLSYGVDASDEIFMAVVRHNRKALDDMSVDLIRAMTADYPQLSLEEYERYQHIPERGGWKGLGYLLDKGITKAYHDAMPLYNQYGITYQQAGFCDITTVIEAIHHAGGRAVLAHPGPLEALPADGLEAFEHNLIRLIALGLDGLECYYPLHTEAVRDICLRVCRERGLMITAGSDCHGAFGDARVGEMDISEELIDLRGLAIE